MPPDPHHHHNHAVQGPSPKPNQKVLSLILKALIMTFITSLFFLFLGVAAILFLCLAGGALHRRRNSGSSAGEPRHPNSAPGFSPRDLRRLPQFRCPKGIEAECVVCLDGFREGQWCRRLVDCSHVFHRRCLDTWLLKVPACPICRTRVRLDLGDAASSSSASSSSASANLGEEAKQWWGFDIGQRI
ncbi:43kDa postsynaptic protein [Parasponia andersonii]|uniref:43kDa postsynaptic protein n=1 Tax=Parasponia andersonii TaxID=3476 RepID=A0A2P5B042_PARAD|nr:43kDa postsynaptic protein [Parasponia andersonii]